MNTLFLYYSFSGNGDLVADRLREKGAEVRKVLPQKPLPRSFFGAIFKGGFLAAIGHKAKLQPWDNGLDGFDRVVIGSPIWNGRFSCPINTVLTSVDLAGKEVFFVFYAASGTAPKALARIQKEYPAAKVVVLKEPKKYSDELNKLDELF